MLIRQAPPLQGHLAVRTDEHSAPVEGAKPFRTTAFLKLGGGGWELSMRRDLALLSFWVALKFLPATGWPQDSQALERFRRELLQHLS